MRLGAWLAAIVTALWLQPAEAADRVATPGVTDTQIKLGQTMPYSGNFSGYAVTGRADLAYFAMINAAGGIHGRKIELISVDDGYSPPRTVEQTRRLVEDEQVLAIFASLGTPTNMSVRKYLNLKKVPQLFIGAGSSKFNDPAEFPWTLGFRPTYQIEGRAFATYIKTTLPNAKVAVLYQNDDAGKDYLKGITEGFGADADKRIVMALSYEVTDPTIDSDIVSLQGSGADVFINLAQIKHAAQAIRKAYDIGWHPVQFMGSVSASIDAVLRPAGFEKSLGIISSAYLKDPTDPAWAEDPGVRDYTAWLHQWLPEGNIADSTIVDGYSTAQLMVYVLEQCGADVSRECLQHAVTNIHGLSLPMLLPGIVINTQPDNVLPIRQLRLQKFDGHKWTPLSGLIP